MMGNNRRLFLMVLSCLIVLAATGCVNTATMYKGNKLPNVPVVSLEEGGQHVGIWQTFDFSMDYRYTQDKGTLDISGSLMPSAFYQMNFGTLTQLIVYFFFVDKDARVLDTAIIIEGGGFDVDRGIPWALRSPIPVPVGATAFSFGYQGSAREALEVTNFYELPLSK